MSELRLRVEGFAARDPEVRQMPSGTQVASFSVPITDRRQNAAGQWEDGETTWVEVIAYGADMVQVVGVVKKGTLIVAEGRAKLSTWTPEPGSAKSGVQIGVKCVLGTLFVVKSAEAVAAGRDAHAAPATAAPATANGWPL